MEILYQFPIYEVCPDIYENENEKELTIIKLSNIVISLLSLISLLISLLTYFIFPNFRKNNALRLIGYLLASNAISNVCIITVTANILTLANVSPTYYFSFTFGINLTLIFSLNLYCDFYHKKSLLGFEKLIIIISTVMSGILVIRFALNYLVTIVIAFIYFIPLMMATIGLYIKVIIGFKKISYPGVRQCMKDLAIYPVVSIVIMILFCTQHILFIMQQCFSDDYFIIIGISCSQGFINAIIYGFNTTVKAEISKKFCKRQQINILINGDNKKFCKRQQINILINGDNN